MFVLRPLACAGFVVTLASASAQAAAPSAFVTKLLGQRPGPGKTFACFTRSYDSAHLAAHPHQNVTSMEVLATYYGGTQQSYQLRIGFHFRNHPELLTTVAECGSRDPTSARGVALCAGPGDGQGQLRLAGRKALLVTLTPGIHLWKPGPPNPKDTVDDAFGPDDKVIRLDRAPTSRCIDQAFEYEKSLPSRQP